MRINRENGLAFLEREGIGADVLISLCQPA